jgi:xanthine dehydrogenase YagT iron-sulfur-binding subunit
VNSCLVLAVTVGDAEVTTSDGLAADGQPHRLHRSFVEYDAFQCGYCTPGQVCSAAGVLEEARAGWPSVVTEDLDRDEVDLTDAEIRERMSGNLCRCAAYANIVPAVAAVAEAEGVRR